MKDLNSLTITGFVEHLNYVGDKARLELYQNVEGKKLSRYFVVFFPEAVDDLRAQHIRKEDRILIQNGILSQEKNSDELRIFVRFPGCVSVVERKNNDLGESSADQFI